MRLLTALALVALALRVVHFVEIGRSPVADLHHWAESDMNTYHVWGERIARGDLWSDAVFHPMHGWHRDAAESQLRRVGVPQAEVEALWEIWAGGKTFHAEPLYAYMIGATYALFGARAQAVHVWQSLAGIAIVIAIFCVSRRLFGDLVATVAASMASLCGPLLFYEMLLLRATALSLVGLLLVAALLSSSVSDSRFGRLGLGLAVGLAVLLKSVFLPFGVGLLVLFGWSRRRLLPVAAIGIGMVLGVTPALVRNLHVGAPPLALASMNAATFAIANGSSYLPEYNEFDAAQVGEILGRSGGEFGATVRETIATHAGIGGYLGLLARKAATIWHWHEMPNNANFYYHRRYSTVLRLLPVTFLIVGPLGLAGLLLSLARFRERWPLLLLAATHLLVLAVALHQSRYRMPLFVALIPFAAWTLVRAASWIADRRARDGLCGIVLAVIALAWIARPLPEQMQLIRDADCLALYAWHRAVGGAEGVTRHLQEVQRRVPDNPGTLTVLGDLALERGEIGTAADYYRRALAAFPGYPLGRQRSNLLESGPP